MHPTANRRSLFRTQSLFPLVAVLAASMLCAAAVAGPLNPPAGAISSTAKPLSEIEPRTAINAANTPGDAGTVFKITQPGSYYLTGNIAGVAGKNGILIASSNVSLDLCGFAVVGGPGSLIGIVSSAESGSGIQVRNGSVSNWGGSGIDLGLLATAFGSVVERITAANNGQYGIVGGASARVVNCTVVGSGNRGIFVFSNSTVSGCTAISSTGDGISVQTGTVVTDCTAWSSTGRGISSSGSATIRGCSAVSSGAEGLFGGSGSVIADSTSYGNTGFGISTSASSTVTGCTSQDNDGGGISVGTGSTVSGCSVYLNTGHGINAGNGCTVSGCNARQNSLNGIQVASSSMILDNNCALNATAGNAAGVLIAGSDNRIEGNNCIGQTRGIESTGIGNFIVRNSCSNNSSNWEIAAGNKCLVTPGANAGAISGNSGGVSPGSTDPNANYSY